MVEPEAEANEARLEAQIVAAEGIRQQEGWRLSYPQGVWPVGRTLSFRGIIVISGFCPCRGGERQNGTANPHHKLVL